MATISFKKGDDYALRLTKLADRTEAVAKKAVYAGAKVLADQISKNLDAMPEDSFRHLPEGEKFSGIPREQKQDLKDSFGVTPITLDKNGYWNAKIGFDGYGSIPTKKYANGVPNQLTARAVESGSSVRFKTPFVRPAVTSKKKAAVEAMKTVVDRETENIMRKG